MADASERGTVDRNILMGGVIFLAGLVIGLIFGYAARPVAVPVANTSPAAMTPPLSSTRQIPLQNKMGVARYEDSQQSGSNTGEASNGKGATETPAMGTVDQARAAIADFSSKFSDPNKNRMESRESVQMLAMQLRLMGPAGLTALKEFLATGQDVKLGSGWALGGGRVDTPSLRLEMIKALSHFGDDGVPYQLGLLEETPSLAEVALLAKNLEKASPGKYRDQVANALRDILADPKSANLSEWWNNNLTMDLVRHFKLYDLVPSILSANAPSLKNNFHQFGSMILQMPESQQRELTLQLLNNPAVAPALTENPSALATLNVGDPQIGSKVVGAFSRMNQQQKTQFLQTLPNNFGLGGNQLFDADISKLNAEMRPQQIARAQAILQFLPQIAPFADTPVLQQRLKDAEKMLVQRANQSPSTAGVRGDATSRR